MAFFYSLSIRLYAFSILLASVFNAKAELWVKGRKNWKKNIDTLSKALKSNSTWFHCASYGEYLQALPLIEALYDREKADIVVSFFSPSGYENYKRIDAVKAIFYLPIDSKKNANYLVKCLQAKRFICVKYDVWPNLMLALEKSKTRTCLIAAEFRPSQIYFKSWGAYFVKALEKFDVVFCQYPNSKKLLKDIGIDAIISGDPRFDQAFKNVQDDYDNPIIRDFIGTNKALFFGSAWEKEIETLGILHRNLANEKFIVAPHNIEKKFIKKLMADFDGDYALLSESNVSNKRILVIDSIGQLRYAYRYARAAIVGGGFSGKLHNIIEALAYNLPVFIGNNHHKFPEAAYAIKLNAAIDASNPSALAKEIIETINNDKIGEMGKNAKECLQNNLGSTKILLKHSIFD